MDNYTSDEDMGDDFDTPAHHSTEFTGYSESQELHSSHWEMKVMVSLAMHYGIQQLRLVISMMLIIYDQKQEEVRTQKGYHLNSITWGSVWPDRRN